MPIPDGPALPTWWCTGPDGKLFRTHEPPPEPEPMPDIPVRQCRCIPIISEATMPIPDGQVVHLRIPISLHARLEQAAEEDGLSRTAVIVAALSAWLDRRRPPTMEEEIARVRERYGYTGDRLATCPRGLDDCGVVSTEACRGCER